MLKYAREDTHYLLYIYDRMRNEAVSRGNETNNILRAVLDRSREVCLSLFEKEIVTPDSYKELYEKYDTRLDDRQMRVFAALFKWRDERARLDDESVRFVLPPHMMFLLAETSALLSSPSFICASPSQFPATPTSSSPSSSPPLPTFACTRPRSSR